jgi:hypothetical protein
MRPRTSWGVAAVALVLLAGCGSSQGNEPPASRGSGSAAPSTPTAPVAPSGSATTTPAPIQPPSLPPNTGTGIVGVVVLVGGCPVAQAEPQCPERRISVPLNIVNPQTNALVTTVTSGTDGTFRVTVAPGHYLISSKTPTGPLMSRAAPVQADVQASRYTSVKMQFQSRIP